MSFLLMIILIEILYCILLNKFVPSSSGYLPTIQLLFMGISMVLIILAIPVTLIDWQFHKSEDNKKNQRKTKRKLLKFQEAARRFSENKTHQEFQSMQSSEARKKRLQKLVQTISQDEAPKMLGDKNW